jgi:DNA-binding transcriptional LysR family regulator
MNWQAVSFDWNQARAFLATVEESSFSGAARALGLTQPTLSRQVSALEESLGVTLLERGHRTMVLTQAGSALVEQVRAMADAATKLSLTASGRATEIGGRVTITATSFTAAFQLPPVIERLRALAPEIEIELIASNDLRDLKKREADIAIRHRRPDQPDLIARLLGETPAYLYASTAYLDRMGRPKRVEDLSRFEMIGFQTPEQTCEMAASLGFTLRPDQVRVHTMSGITILEFARHGLGMSMMQSDIAARWPELEPVLPEVIGIPVPTWLVTHRELNTSKRIRLVFDLIAEGLTTRAPL